MKKALLLLSAAGGLLVCSGCQPVASPLMGVIYNETKFGYEATSNHDATKEGKACGQTILGMVATGDASISAAKAAGGITEISHVDHSAKNIVGIIAEFCTIVKGK